MSLRCYDVRDRYEQHDYDTMLDPMTVTDDGNGFDVIVLEEEQERENELDN